MSSVESLALLVVQLQQTVFTLSERVRALEQERLAPPSVAASTAPARPTGLPATLEERRQREHTDLLETLNATGWNRLEAAKRLGMPRRTFYRRMREYGIQDGDSRRGITTIKKKRRKQKG